MPYIGDPPSDSMARRIERRIRSLLSGSSDLDDIVVFYRGEPGPSVPIQFFPFVIVFLTDENEATGEDGYSESTGIRYFRYDGYVSIEVIHRDVDGLYPDENRYVDVPSYDESTRLTQAAFSAVMTWGGVSGEIDNDPVTSADGREITVELRSDTINNGLTSRRDNVSNRGTFAFHVFTRRLNF